MTREFERAVVHAKRYLDSLETRQVSRPIDASQLRSQLHRELPERGTPPGQVIDELAADAEAGLLHTASGRFFGWVIGGGLPASVAADWLVSVWNQNAAAYACSPSAAAIEEIVADWLKGILGLPKHASYAFVTGCQMAHFTALAAARHRVLARLGWSVEEDGLCGSPPIRVLVGVHHETLLRALRHLGIGSKALTQLDLLETGTVDPSSLERELNRQPSQPTIVSLAAGDLNRGTFDPFGTLCDLAHQHDAWVHIDGAFGLWASASPRFRHLVQGIERADSWATDAHKWLNVPYDSGVAFVADPEAHRASMAIPAAYKVEVEGVRDQFEWGPEWSRRARGIPIYAALRALGKQGVAELVERCCDLTQELVIRLGALQGVEVLATPIINQGLVRFLDPKDPEGGDHDARTDEVIARVNNGGEAWFGPTVWQNQRVMRISTSNFRTSPEDIDRVVKAFETALSRP